MARKDRFLVALGVECTLSDGFVEQYLRPRQSTLTYRPVRTSRKRQAKQPCLDAEGSHMQKATDVIPQYGWMTCM